MPAETSHSLTNLDNFGDVAAEDDAVLDYFLATNAVDRIASNKAFLVLGRKGTGKTAIVRYFTEGPGKKTCPNLLISAGIRGMSTRPESITAPLR